MTRSRFAPSIVALLFASFAFGPLGCGSSDDNGAVDTDAGASNADTGVTRFDAGTHPTDAGTKADSGAKPPDDAGAPLDAMANPDVTTGGKGGLPPDAGTTGPTGPATDLLIRVTNFCPVDVWVHGAAQEGVLAPDNAHLVPGASQEYYGPVTWTAGRIYAYLEAPDGDGNPQGQNDKIEMNFGTGGGGASINTDITYVDWIALPSAVQAIGTGSDCTTVGCQLPYAHILDGCPSSLLTGHECVSAGSYCLDPTHDSDPFCHAVDAQIAACASQYSDCAGASGGTSGDVYSCSGGFFNQSPEYCAAINRGVLSQPGTGTPASAFYVSPPFNEYSAWVHKTCPGIYAFPYDDYGSSNQSSDHTCTGATQLNITFCPNG